MKNIRPFYKVLHGSKIETTDIINIILFYLFIKKIITIKKI